MDEQYDVIVLGTGLKECILSGLLSVSGKKVLHIDRNKYYGGESASITPLEDLFQKFGVPMPENTYGRTRDWNVDLIPKFLMANGQLVKLLIHTGVTRYLEFKSVEGSYVYNNKSITKVPATTTEATKFGRWNILESKRLFSFLSFVLAFNSDDSATWHKSLDPKKVTTKELFDEFQLSARTVSLIGHALALHSEDTYLDQPHEATIHRIRMYADSLARYGKSPYLYPLYGLGELPQGFARLAAIYGGTYMLDKPVDELVMEDGRVAGVRSGDEVARCKQVYCDPSYVNDRVKKVGKVVRGIFLLDHPIPNTANASSVQIILPHDQLQHNSDIYISMVSNTHKVASPEHYIAMVSTTVETDNPEAEIAPGVELLGKYKQKFLYVSDMFEPLDDGSQSQVFVSKSYDASTHFETTSIDVLDLYRRGTGADFDFSQVKNKLEDNE